MGRIIVDLLGVLVMILSLTGICYTFLRRRLMRRKDRESTRAEEEQKHRLSKRLSTNFKWHKAIGRKTFYAVLFVFVTGWVLRPPLMLPLVFTKAQPNRFSSLYSDNPWFDRLRAIREDKHEGGWLLSTSEGFYRLKDFTSVPEPWELQPQVSPMGINGFAQRADGSWLVGSFSGLFEVHPRWAEPMHNYFTGESVGEVRMGPPVGSFTVSGLLAGERPEDDLVFLYDHGAVGRTGLPDGGAQLRPFAPQPEALNQSPYSLWQAALELHAGRLYQPFLGSWGTALFIFFLGLVSVIVLITGLKRRSPKKKH